MIPPLIALLAWIPISLYFFWRYPLRVAILINFVAGWALLPSAAFAPTNTQFPYWILGTCLPSTYFFTKASVTGMASLIGVLLFDRRSFGRFRLSLCLRRSFRFFQRCRVARLRVSATVGFRFRFRIARLACGAFGIVVYVPAGTFELQGGSRNQLIHLSTAVRVNQKRLVGKLLKNFEFLTAGFALVLVNRHVSLSFYNHAKKKTGCNPVRLHPGIQNQANNLLRGSLLGRLCDPFSSGAGLWLGGGIGHKRNSIRQPNEVSLWLLDIERQNVGGVLGV